MIGERRMRIEGVRVEAPPVLVGGSALLAEGGPLRGLCRDEATLPLGDNRMADEELRRSETLSGL
jgi:hypothetical protein